MPRRRKKRPSLVQDKFCEGLKLGMTIRLACKYAGIEKSTYYEWLARAAGTHSRRRTKEHADFAEAANEAEMESLAPLLERLRKATKDPAHWRSIIAILERRWPEDFGRTVLRQEVTVSGEVGTRVTLDDTAKSAAEKLAGLLAERTAVGGDDDPSGDAEPG